jgi:hypothetical protein
MGEGGEDGQAAYDTFSLRLSIHFTDKNFTKQKKKFFKALRSPNHLARLAAIGEWSTGRTLLVKDD